MSFGRIVIPALSFAASAVAVALVVWLMDFFGPSGFTDGKTVLARLQGLEFEHRDQKILTPELFADYKDTGPIVVVGTSDPSFPYSWIAVTVPVCDGELCMVGGHAPIDIKCTDLHELETRVAMTKPVEQMLTNTCR